MKNIIVTTPKSQMEAARREAEDVRRWVEEGYEPFYFRNLGRNRPKHFQEGGLIFYVEDGYVRGYARVVAITEEPQMYCESTERAFGPGVYAIMDAQSWRWIEPVAMRGFQGWRYTDLDEHAVVHRGAWRDPRPTT